MKGGKREGAGRPVSTAPAPTIQTAIRLSPAHLAKFKELGGVRWIRRLLDEAAQIPPAKEQELSFLENIAKPRRASFLASDRTDMAQCDLPKR